MKDLQLKTIWKPKFVHATDSNHNLPMYDNVLDRQFEMLWILAMRQSRPIEPGSRGHRCSAASGIRDEGRLLAIGLQEPVANRRRGVRQKRGL
ncbi:hypothetical protein A1355_22555 [Methylomonas koyamae]|uniref:Uncharacterized protein n=1 Tax=Methylomonas koyamae TaxID=702114 RepID=A0A177NXJ0_9GAMM|nr:hypothetical protein A1355_22555 [Methylomonas koyamae]